MQGSGQAAFLRTGAHAKQQPDPKQWLAKQNDESPKTRHSAVHLPKIHHKPFRFYSVNTKRGVGRGNKKETPLAKVSQIQKLGMAR